MVTVNLANETQYRPDRARFPPYGGPFRSPGVMGGHLRLSIAQQHVQSFEVEGQADQTPLASHSGQAAQRELAKAQYFLDDPDHRLNCRLAQPVDGLTNGGLQLVGHLDHRTGIIVWGHRLRCKSVLPTLVMRFAARGDVGLNATRFQLRDVFSSLK